MDRIKMGRLLGVMATGLSTMLLCTAAWAQEGQPTEAPTSPASEASPEKLPTGEEVIEKFIEATGGRAAYAKLTNRVTEGEIDIPVQNVKGKTTLTQAEPNRMVMKADFPGVGTQTQGTDGETVWEVNSMMGPRILEGEERATSLRLATFNSETQWRKLYSKVEVKGVSKVDDVQAYEVELVGTDGQKTTNFYDKETGLLLKALTTMKSQMGETPVESKLEDYREVDGIKMPFKTTQSLMGVQIIMIFDSVKHNVDLPADTFALPEEVKQLKDGGAKPAEGEKPAETVPQEKK